ncbi:metallophosphoesterase family protein [Paludisphaera rhizosphaerae]|uniref:metallophosphoesterase family protein n=1 Tax=Paludisphaera rhizosphaerae TaxID=2711216 RepID=UPI0013EC48FB|nr:metallophosphoesterase [Paludisphaera rhizosphaerae]
MANEIIRPGEAKTRRGFLAASGGLGAAGILGGSALIAAPPGPDRKRVLRVAHLTDVHVKPEDRGAEGMAACLHHVQDLNPKPDFILLGGDHVMDCFKQKYDRTKVIWDLYGSVLKAECSIPVYSCVGNHDVWGWDKGKAETRGDEPLFGKKWTIDAAGMPDRYYSFTKAGWKFLVIDSIQPGPTPVSFAAFLDEAQLDWLKRELRDTPPTTPILYMSHVPIFSAMALYKRRKDATTGGFVNCGDMHTDGTELLDLLSSHPNVKVCLSGHLHLMDSCRIRNVDFYCNAAVCAAWWWGAYQGFGEGYGVYDLYDDGSHDFQWHGYGWKAEPRAGV